MNRRMILSVVGKMVMAEGILMLLPLIVSGIYREACLWSFTVTAGAAILVGFLLVTFAKPRTPVIYAKEGFFIVSASWILFSLIGALPFTLSGEIPSYIDAVFETVSGFTTTGSSVLTDVEALSHGLLFWRSFTHWIGGMGILVFVLAVIPNISERSIHILRAEVPGPTVGKLVPRIKDTAKILYLIYVGMTAIQVILLLCGGMPLFDSLLHAFGTAGTGGFGIKADSLAGYSPYLQWVITIFMFLFGVNFNVYYLILIRRFKSALKSTEFWVYLGIVLGSILLICFNIYSQYGTVEETVRHAAFQVSSVITTTGFATTDFDLWPTFSKGILLLLMFVGACAGSTGGGIKVSRVTLVFKQIRREFQRLLHPRAVKALRFEGRTVEEQTLTGVNSYLGLYFLCFAVIFLIISLEPFGLETNFSAVAACFNNIGPGFGAVGPTASFAEYSNLSKIVLSAAMLLGRLEIFPLLIFFSPSSWLKK